MTYNNYVIVVLEIRVEVQRQACAKHVVCFSVTEAE